MTMKRMLAAVLLALAPALAACSSQEANAADGASGQQTAATADAAAEAVAPTGNVIEVKMVTDGAGNYFEPADFTVNRGDVVRFVLVSGVHNVSFPAADNPGASSLPEATPYLQLPGQTYDLTVDLPAGDYTYQCDPHAMLGMVGTMTVE